jgi:tripartite-type tricarboxylate transporter receptor subunit TctC
LLAAFLLISIMIGGCTSMQNETVITPKVEKYPDKPIILIVPYSAGGGLDITARILEKTAVKYLGQPLTIINKPGGAGTIGWNELAGSAPDGYTIGMTVTDILLPSLYGPTKYNYPTAIEPLAQTTVIPFVMAIQADQPWQTLDDLVTYAKTHPTQLKFGHSGIGSLNHIVGEMLAHATGITLEQVPFRGATEFTSALLGGHIQIIFTNPAVIKEQVKSGTVRALAVTGDKRLKDPVFAHIPTFKEQGFDIVLDQWYGIAVPKELPIGLKTTLTERLKVMITSPEFIQNMENLGMQVEYLGPKESQLKWISDSQKLTRAIQETGIVDLINSQKQ